jgi:hypothetical protein
MTGKRKGPLEIKKLSPEEWEALGLPRSVLVVSSTSAKQYGQRPRSETQNSPSGQKPPARSSKKRLAKQQP